MRKLLIIFVIGLMCSEYAGAQYESPFNNLRIKADSVNSYSFIVSGHFYGNSSNSTGYPTNTLLANLDWINSRNDLMLVSLGDLFMDISNDIPYYEKSFFSKLNIPLVNTVGNHDLTDNIYQNTYGQTDFSFSIANDLHIIIDSERNDGDLDEEQIALLKKSLSRNYDKVFIYSHRTIWKNTYKEMDGIFEDNTQSAFENNFESEIYPILKEISRDSKVYWFSGSMGDAPASFFYHKDEGITYIATSIRGLKRDAMLIVDSNDKQVQFTPYSLTGENLNPLETYNVDFWQEHSGKRDFNWRLLPMHIKNILSGWNFWWGVISTAIIVFSIGLFMKKRKRRLNQSKKEQS